MLRVRFHWLLVVLIISLTAVLFTNIQAGFMENCGLAVVKTLDLNTPEGLNDFVHLVRMQELYKVEKLDQPVTSYKFDLVVRAKSGVEDGKQYAPEMRNCCYLKINAEVVTYLVLPGEISDFAQQTRLGTKEQSELILTVYQPPSSYERELYLTTLSPGLEGDYRLLAKVDMPAKIPKDFQAHLIIDHYDQAEGIRVSYTIMEWDEGTKNYQRQPVQRFFNLDGKEISLEELWPVEITE